MRAGQGRFTYSPRSFSIANCAAAPPTPPAPSRVPAELQTEGAGNVDVELKDKRGEEYVKPAYTAYSGAGQTIG